MPTFSATNPLAVMILSMCVPFNKMKVVELPNVKFTKHLESKDNVETYAETLRLIMNEELKFTLIDNVTFVEAKKYEA